MSRSFVLQERLNQLQQEDSELLKKIRRIKAALREEMILQDRLEQQEDVSLSEPRPPPASPMFC